MVIDNVRAKKFKFEERVVEQWQSLKPRLQDFIGDKNYAPGEVRQDLDEMREKGSRILTKLSFGREREYQLAEETEFCLMEAFQNFGWFSEEVTVSPASDFDDLFRGVDFVLTFADDPRRAARLAVDVTIAFDADIIVEKERRIRDRLERGQMTEVKYFVDDQDKAATGRIKAPHIVIAVLPIVAEEFRDLIAKGRSLSFIDQKRIEEIKTELLARIDEQLRKYIDFLSTLPSGTPNVKNIIASYDRVRQLFLRHKK